jgi:hypothetical protein
MRIPDLRFKAVVLMFVAACTAPGFSLPTSAPASTVPEDARSLVSRMVSNELNAQKNPRYWMYLDSVTKPGHAEIDRVLQLPQCWMRWPISINGRPPTQAERQSAAEKLEALVSDAEARRKNREELDQDAQKANSLLQILPDAFLYTRQGRNGNLIHLRFRPNPNYSPPSNEAKVFHQMAGVLLINAPEIRLATLSGRLTSDVDFGLGILGKIYKGGTFEVVQSQVAPRDWEVYRLDVNISGRALFFHTISQQQHEIKTQFKPVPRGLALAGAAALIKKGGGPGARRVR